VQVMGEDQAGNSSSQVFHSSDEKVQGFPVETTQVLQLHDIDPPLTRFDLRDEGLRSI